MNFNSKSKKALIVELAYWKFKKNKDEILRCEIAIRNYKKTN